MLNFSSEFKWAIAALAAIGLILGGYKLYRAGYDDAMATVDHDNRIATDTAIQNAKNEWIKSQTITKEGMANVQDTKQKIIYITQKADTIVAPKCVDMGNDYSGLYNQYIDTIQGNANSGGNQFDAKVPAATADENATKH